MGEVATWSMIRSKISSFPAPTSGRGNECLTYDEIISMGGDSVSDGYENEECVELVDVRLKNNIHIDIDEEELDENESCFTYNVHSEYLVASTLSVDVRVKIGRHVINKTLYILKGESESEYKDYSGSPMDSAQAEIIFISPEEDNQYLYILQENY